MKVIYTLLMKEIAIIWAWASWLMAAATLLESDLKNYHIHLFEKNSSIWNKVLISWWWRCNVTTGITDKKILETKYTRGWEFIKKSFWKFSPKKCQEWFTSHWVPLKVESDMRVFPVSDNGSDVIAVFEDIFAKNRNRITIHYREWIVTVEKNKEWWFFLNSQESHFECDVLLITTWGNAYAHTWSSWDGYAFARSLGHTVTKLWPSLSSFLTKEKWLHQLSGLSLPEAMIDGLKWPLLFTHFGISWPLAFMVSSALAWVDIGKGIVERPSFSPVASMNTKDWDVFLRESFQKSPKKTLVNILSEKLPKRFAEGFVGEFFSDLWETYVGSISKKSRESIAKLLGDGIPLTLVERRPWDEFVTAWWVHTDEIDSETMQSKIHKNLYFAGEVLNVDGYTGWFSLQLCWASGYIAGKSISEKS